MKNKSSKELINNIKNFSPEQGKIYEKALYQKSNDNFILSQITYDIATHFYNNEQYPRSIYYLNKSVHLARKINNDSLLCKFYLKTGNAYLKDWKNQKSLDAYYEALNIAKKKKNTKHVLIAQSGISIIHRRMGQLDKALDVCKNALKLIEKSSYYHKTNHVSLLTILSEIYLDQKKYDSVIKYANIGIEMSERIDYSIGAIDLYTKKGIVYFDKNELEKAHKNLYEAEEILSKKNITQKKSILNVNYFIAYCLYKEQLYTQAISRLEKIQPILTESDSRNIRVLEIYRLLIDCYVAIDKKEESIFWLQKLIKLQDQFQDEKNKTVSKLHHKTTEELAKQIMALENQKKKEKQYKEYTFISLLFVFVLLVVFIFKFIKKQKKNNVVFQQLITKINSLETKEVHTPKNLIITDEKVQSILNGLIKLEKQEYFLHTECDLRSMAKKVKTNTTYLSKIIKEHKAKSFNDYINDLRIEYVLKRLKNDRKFRSFSIKSIALEIGYKTDKSFTKHFKAKTGLNPSYYIKKINHDQNQ
ncbi:helix-turn-helix domain-containing protein [Aquimarina sp. D1M17]|uniref:helix-turn-helix domain-containing protein n=1 Tax=Aquimarina acroporae TaxID=2937283 RepID=UPI0020BE6335|nr:helix-turn-helix domain-containing protein [Aquimarina acroporae]MCK8523748.1 helix-turn-helix domain-containing protein [Aquimarina acroporae]